jgi:hypothetical protein
MPELYVEPHILTDAGRSLATERSTLSEVAGAVAPALGTIAAALPGSRAAEAATQTGAALAATVRSAAGELAQLAGALSAAAREYRSVEHVTAAGIERGGRRPT